MKLTRIDENEALSEELNYLALDKDGQLWFIGGGGGVFLDDKSGTIYDEKAMRDALIKFGPFTKFNGKITLEN